MAATEISMTGHVIPIVLDQGSTHVIDMSIKDENNNGLDMTGYDVRSQVRPTFSSSTLLINSTLANNKITWVDQTSGTFQLTFSAVDTAAIRFPRTSEEDYACVYDVEMQSPTGVVTKILRGPFTIIREVTR